MKKLSKQIKLFVVGAILSSGSLFGQQIVNHTVNFDSGTQNMWGESWSAFSIDQEITLFDVPWNTSINQNLITTLAGQSFGFGLDAGFSGVIGSKVSLEGFTTGTVDVDYPINVRLDMDSDLTYDQGDDVSINTSYTVNQPGYAINTLYPSLGEFKWDVYFRMAANASATLCFFSCTTFPIIPSFDTGLQTINLATASGNGATTGGQTGVWWLGAGDPTNPFAQEPGIAGWPYAWPPQVPPYLTPSSPGNAWIPWQVHVPAFPATFDTPFGFSGSITLPYVNTSTTITGDALQACGDSTYLTASLELFKLLGAILDFSPPPGPAIGLVLSNLSGSVEVGPAEINWNIFSASIVANVTNRQCFDFTPTVWGRFEYPVPVDYQIYDPVSASLSAMQTSTIVNVEIGQEIRFKFPCYFENINIVPTYYIQGTGNNFSNQTWDEIQFSFDMSALEFGIVVPSVIIIPEINVPEICIPIPYPCPTWSNPFRWCSYTACTPAFTIPAVTFPGVNVSYGPVWSTSIAIGPPISYDWYNNSWNLEGFQEYTFPSFRMRANQLSITNTFTNVSCFGGNDGSINITPSTSTAGSTPATPYTYTWTNGATSQDLTGLTAGPYEVSVIDANNCQLFTGATITEPQQPISISYSSSNKNCNGGLNDGAIDITVIGGTAPYTYAWSNASTSEDLTGIAAGTYTVTVTDSMLCTEVLSVTITEPNVLGQVGAITSVNCNGDADGAIAIDVFGGTLPYSYSWSGPSSYTSNVEDITLLSGGNYTLTITDGNGCVSAQGYNVTEPIAPVNLSISGVDVACKYDSTGSVDLTVAGGTPGYTFQWFTSTGVVLPFMTEDLTGVPTETYSVIVTDANGCTEQISQLVDEPIASLTSTEVLTHINCFGDATGVIDPVITGGTAPYIYTWSNGASTSTISTLIAGTYTLDITDANLCTASFSYTLTEPQAALSVTSIGTDVLCNGENTGFINSTISGGTEPYLYSWSNGASTASIADLIAGVYTLNVTDANGCIDIAVVNIGEPALPLTSLSTVVDVDCYGNNSGSIDLTPNGGTLPYSYVWSNGGSVILNTINEDISNLYADTYTSVVTDNNGCMTTLATIVSEPSAPLFIAGIVDDVNCFGLNDGGIDISVSGGTTAYTYSWSNGAITQDITNIIAGSYTVTVTDNNLCTEMITFDVLEPMAPIAIVLTATDVLCNGGSDGIIHSDVSGGTSPYVYSWSNGGLTDEVIGLTAGSYTLTITDAEGCTAFTGAVVNEPAQALTVTSVVTDASCYEYSDGEIVISITGGVQPYYFNWGNQNEILLNNASETLSDLPQGDYFIRVQDENGCIDEQIITVNQPAPYVASSVISDALCFNGNSGAIDLILVGGTSPYSVVWDNGMTTEDILNVTSGTYTYVATDNQGCEVSGELFIDQPAIIDISEQVTQLTCIDQSDAAIEIFPYGGTEPYTFVWNNGETTQNIANVLSGTYDVMVVDVNGCNQTFVFEIFENEEECIGIPNTFTPNGDNYNDTWLIRNIDLYPNASVKVFNKWGNEIYVSEGVYKPWDGLYNGKPLPSEVYYYIIVLDNEQDNKYTGTITIIR